MLQTRARNEKVVADALERQQVRHYLPLARMDRTWGGRRVSVTLPLFPGYLFLEGGADACEAAWKTRRVAKILPVNDQDRLRAELRHVQQVVESGVEVDLHPALEVGRRCRVTGGTLKGLEGVVMRRRRRSRLHIAVTMLGQSAVVEIDSALLESAD